MLLSNQLADTIGLMRVSEFERHRGGPAALEDTEAGTTRLSALNPSLKQDLLRFGREHRPGEGLDVLEVLAAALRHGRDLLLHLQLDYRVIPLTVWPVKRRAEAPVPIEWMLELRLPELRVLRVEPAPHESASVTVVARAAPDASPPAPRHRLELGMLLWELALRGARAALLPEIAGVAAYRVAPGAELQALDLTGSLAAAVDRLQRQTVTLREIADWPGFDRDRAQRLLNGLYLQAALMISRSHPGAIQGR